MTLFARRKKPSRRSRLLENIWPKLGWIRFSYYLFWRLMRISSAPHDVAAGAAAGVAVSFTPLVGAHITLAILAAVLLRGNVLAAVLGTIVGNPLTFPFFWGISYQVGKVMEGYWILPHFSYFEDFIVLKNISTVFWGSVPTATVVLVILYPIFRQIVSDFQKRKKAGSAMKTPKKNPMKKSK